MATASYSDACRKCGEVVQALDNDHFDEEGFCIKTQCHQCKAWIDGRDIDEDGDCLRCGQPYRSRVKRKPARVPQ